MPRPKYRSRQRLASLGAALLLVLLLTDGCAVSDRKEPAPSPLDGVLSLYQGPLNHLSAVRAGGCPMHPSCSVYSRQALAQHPVPTLRQLLEAGRKEVSGG